jgi:hypothetical protein
MAYSLSPEQHETLEALAVVLRGENLGKKKTVSLSVDSGQVIRGELAGVDLRTGEITVCCKLNIADIREVSYPVPVCL